jgi:hypothetical protein
MWSLFWRAVVLTPVALLGLVAFGLAGGLTIMPPFYAAIELFNGEYLLACFALVLWALWLRFGGSARRFVFEGLDQGSL